MGRRAELTRMARGLRAAAEMENWQVMEAIDRELRAALPRLDADGAWQPAELSALEALRAMHRQAQARCASALSKTAAHLAELQNQKEAWLAYAAGSELEEDDS